MPDTTQPLWELRNLSKSFYAVQALNSVSCKLYQGEVHALLGENGSGKSTLAKCLAGVHEPDSGEMLLNGEPMVFHHPIDARVHGVATIYQEFSLVPTLTVAENVFLGRQLTGATRIIDWEAIRRQTVLTLEELEIHINPDETLRNLSVAEQQLVEIAKAISLESNLLIMDEPTAALGLAETERLLALIKRLAAQGKAILYISHRLDEVFQVADVVTVLKDGNLVATHPVSDLKMDDVVRMMVGVDIEQHYPKVINVRPQVCMEVEGLSTDNGVNDVSFTMHEGEVLGLGGMVGSGRTEIARALFGVDKHTGGVVRLFGEQVRFNSPTQAISHGVGLIPENRKADGLFFNFAAPPNITSSRLKDVLTGLFLSLGKEKNAGQQFIDKLRITPAAMEKSVQFLSGGNQQKVVVARWLFSQARVLILDEPTQGIDVGAKLDVYDVINELTAQGISILLISSDYPELLAMSDRIAVVRDGRILMTTGAKYLTEYQLLAIASGVELGEYAPVVFQMREIALPHLYTLRDSLHVDVRLAILERDDMRLVYLDRISVEGTAEAMARSAGHAPLTCTGLGKVLLAHEPAADVEQWFKAQEIPAFTAATITDAEDLAAELAEVRRQGFALDRGESDEQVRCIAAPIVDADGVVLAAVSVTGSPAQMPDDLASSDMRQALVDTARVISQALEQAMNGIPHSRNGDENSL